MARVVRTAFVTEEMKRKDWSVVQYSDMRILFRHKRDGLLPVPLHPTRPDLIYVDELLPRIRDLRQEIIAEAFEELPTEELGFDVVIAPGRADDADIQALFDALSDLSCVLGGSGLAAEEIEAVAV